MKFGILLLSLIILLLLTGVLPVGNGQSAGVVYYTPLFILLLALLSGSSVWCCIKREFSLKQIGFYGVHLGVAAILIGAFVGYIAGKKGTLQLFVDQPMAASALMDDPSASFGFDVRAEDFSVKFYPPVYHLYRQIPSERIQAGQMPFEKVSEYDTAGRDVLDLDGFGSFDVANLWDEGMNTWSPRRMLDSGSFLHLASQTPSHFGVTLHVDDARNKTVLPISINHPASYKGWRFYLMSYDQMRQSYVVLSARQDPGRSTVIAGMWVTMISTFVLCFRRTGGVR